MSNDTHDSNEAHLHAAIAEQVGLSVEELETWMISQVPRETEGGEPVGRMVVFRESTPAEVLDKVKNKDSQFTAHTGVIDQ